MYVFPGLAWMDMHRRKFIAGAGATAAITLAGCTGDDGGNGNGGNGGNGNGGNGNGGNGNGGNGDDEDFPSETMTLTVPYGTSGGYDAYTRLTAQTLADYVDVDITVQNVEGAGGQVAMEQVYNSDPSGYNIILANGSAFGLLQIQEDVNYDLTEASYICQVAEDISALAVGTDTGIDSWEAYLDAAENEELTYGSNGWTNVGTIVPVATGIATERYSVESVLDNTVIYDGRGPMIPALERGDIDVMAGTYHSILPFHESDDIEILMINTMDDDPLSPTPNAETLATADVNNGQTIIDLNQSTRPFIAPPDVPENRVEILRDAFEQTLTSDELQEAADEAERPVTWVDGEQAEQNIVGFLEEWGERSDLLEELIRRD